MADADNVATVNGLRVTQADFDSAYDLVRLRAPGVDVMVLRDGLTLRDAGSKVCEALAVGPVWFRTTVSGSTG